MGRSSVTPQRGAQMTGGSTSQWLITREVVWGCVVRWIRREIDGWGSSSTMNKSPASSNPSGSVGVHRGHTGAPVTTVRRANDEVDDSGFPGTGSSSLGGSNCWLPSSPAAAGSQRNSYNGLSPFFREGG